MQELDAGQRLLLDQLHDEYQRRHGVAVEYLKRAVGPGEEYCNGVARVVVSRAGAWFECLDQPMEFSGAVGGRPIHRFVTDSQALTLLDDLRSLAESADASDTRLCRLLVLYEPAGIVDEKGAHLVHHESGSSSVGPIRRHVGSYRTGQLPLVFRCRFDTSREVPGVDFRRGVVLGISGLGERNLILEIPYSGQDVRDLGGVTDLLLPQ